MKTYTCDLCRTHIDNPEEMVSIKHQYGYNSNGRDGDMIELDICERCLQKIEELDFSERKHSYLCRHCKHICKGDSPDVCAKYDYNGTQK